MFLKAHSALLATLIAVAAMLPASAQGFNVEEVKRMQKSMPDIGRPYAIRVTTGATSNAGFEKALTETDPNLKHWCWVPVTNFNQAYIKMAPGKVDHGQPNYQRPKSVYVKPITVALPKIRRSDIDRQICIRMGGSSRSSSDVSAKLSYNKEPNTRAYQAEQKVLSYSNSDCSGRLSAPRYTSAYNSESKDVYGKLVSRSQTH